MMNSPFLERGIFQLENQTNGESLGDESLTKSTMKFVVYTYIYIYTSISAWKSETF